MGYAGAAYQEPDRRRRLRERQRGESQDTREASADIQRIGYHPLGIGVEGPAERLAQPDEHKRDQDEEQRSNPFDRQDELSQIRIAVLGTEKNLLRRCLMSDINRKPTPVSIQPDGETR